MNKSKDQFYTKSPSKILEKAQIYSKNIQKYHDLPKATAKSMFVSQVAQDQRDFIEYAVDNQKCKLQLYRKKQQIDSETRAQYQKKIKDSLIKVQNNEKEILKKKQKQAQAYQKHLNITYKRYQDEQKRHRQSQKQQAYKLRKELQEFYEKQEERKKIAELKQIQVGTQYQKAVERINNIHKKNQQYSLRAEMDLDEELRKNNHFKQILGIKRRTVSAINQNKSQIYNKNISIFNDRESHFIQKYGHNEAESLSAWKHIEEDSLKTTKRLNEFFKRRVQKWASQKKRVDAAKAQIPRKCLDILDKTSKSAFRKTVSTFKDSSSEWYNTVHKNKSVIKEYDQMKKDQIMNTHLDLRMTNNSSFKIREKMGSMKHQARKIANAYL